MGRFLKFIITTISLYVFIFVSFVICIRNLTFSPGDYRNYAIAILTGDKNRIKMGINLAQELGCKNVLISGVHTKTNLKDINKFQLRNVKPNDIDSTIGYSALNTVGNVLETSRWCKKNNFKNVIVVTSDYHVPRVVLEFLNLRNNKNMVFYGVRSEKIDIKFVCRCFKEFNRCVQRLIVRFLYER